MAFSRGSTRSEPSGRTRDVYLLVGIVMLVCLVSVAVPAGMRGRTAAAGLPDAPAIPVRVETDREGGIRDEISGIVNGNNRFSLDLYGILRKEKGNLFFSPLSIRSALAVVHAGARGRTQREIGSVLHIAAAEPCFDSSFALFRKCVHAADNVHGVEFKAADSLWVRRGYELKEGFLDISKRSYGASVFEADFAASPEGARDLINGWVLKNTGNRVGGLLQEGVIRPDTVLVIADAVYFSGQWADQFDEQESWQGIFRLDPRKTVPIMMMHRRGMVRTTLLSDMRIIELPYARGALSMIILLPQRAGGLEGLENRLDEQGLSSWMKALSQARMKDVSLTFPRFSLTGRLDLMPVLKSLGMENAFSSAADFFHMAEQTGLFISAVVHQARVEVHERGTEAAAATGTVMTKASSDPVRITVDHPFLFLIRESATGAILFMGRLADPTS